MRRLGIGLALTLTILLIVGTAATALPPGFCDDGREHPGCPTTTTTSADPPVLEPCETSMSLAGTGTVGFECDWAPELGAGEDPRDGLIEVASVGDGVVSRLVVMVRDSSPGDICELSWDGRTESDWEWYEGPLFGTLELLVPLTDVTRGDYWGYDWNPDDDVASHGEHWCEPYDPVDGQRQDLNGDPLHLMVNMRGKKGAAIEISLGLVPATP